MEEEKRLAIISIIIEDKNSVQKVNEILTSLEGVVRARMGLPMPDIGKNIITLVAFSPAPLLNSVTGKLGMLSGVTAKTLMR